MEGDGVTFALGIYDLFAYSIPGFLYISVFGYIANRVGWFAVDLKDLKDVPSLLVVLGFAIAAYLIGHVTWPLSRLVDRLSHRRWPWRDAAEIIIERDPELEKSEYLRHSRFLLQARAELTNREVASEISRMRAIGLMLRNCTIPLLIASTCALVELAIGEEKIFAGIAATLLLLAAIGAAIQSRTMGQWAILKTFELSYWTFAPNEVSKTQWPMADGSTPRGDLP